MPSIHRLVLIQVPLLISASLSGLLLLFRLSWVLNEAGVLGWTVNSFLSVPIGISVLWGPLH